MKRNGNRGMAGMLGTVLILLVLTGCGRQISVPEEKIVIKILYNGNFNQVKELVESACGDIELQTELSLYTSEQLRRLDRGVGPDLVITAQPDSNMVRKHLLDISDTKASAAYDGTIMNAWKTDGKTYICLLYTSRCV